MSSFPCKGLLLPVEGGAFVANTAVLTADVELARDVSIWFGCVLRGDDAAITIGRRSNVQDLTMVHADPGVPNHLGGEPKQSGRRGWWQRLTS